MFELFSVKKNHLYTEMCVTVYYLNVSGLQSGCHSINKEKCFGLPVSVLDFDVWILSVIHNVTEKCCL